MNFDPRMTFDSFVVGPANRLASAAARRVAEHPGRSYNPLFLYSASGLGKSHILTAIAHHALRQDPDREVVLQPLEVFLGELTDALERGQGTELEARYATLDILLLDDVQFLAGQKQAQEMLLRTLDGITSRGGQVALASDRPPSEMEDLDARLLSRFSGGLIVDLGPPDLETRVAIVRRKARDRGAELAPGVAEVLARSAFRNVRELQGALNRVLVLQELEGRAVTVEELPEAVGGLPQVPPEESMEPEWRQRLQEAVAEAEAEGFVTQPLSRMLDAADEPEGWERALEGYLADLERSREISRELEELGNPWPEAAATLLRDPGRLDESEALLASARERARSFPEIPPGPDLADLEEHVPALAQRAADRLLTAERPDYNPLYVHSTDPDRARVFLEAAGRTHRSRVPEARVALISVEAFSNEFVDAIANGVAGAWRERWWTVEVLLLHGLERLTGTERAQEEFFHLFEALRRRDARILLASERLPSDLEKLDDRLRSRFEGGLVVELGDEPLPDALVTEELAETPAVADVGPAPDSAVEPILAAGAVDDEIWSEGPGSDETEAGTVDDTDDLAALKELAGVGRARRRTDRRGGRAGDSLDDEDGDEGPWTPSRERVVWDWPAVDDRVVEDF